MTLTQKAIALWNSTSNPLLYIIYTLHYHKGKSLRDIIVCEYDAYVAVQEFKNLNELA